MTLLVSCAVTPLAAVASALLTPRVIEVYVVACGPGAGEIKKGWEGRRSPWYSTAVLSSSVVSDSLRLHRLQPARLLSPWGFSRQEYWSGLPCAPPGDPPNPEIKPKCPALQVDSLQSEPPGKPKNTEVGSLSLLEGLFQTQESNQGFLYCRRILYQLSYP